MPIHAPTRTIALATLKGGAGKTTTAVNLATGLALRGETVLLVDLDPQANATAHLGIVPDDHTVTLYELLLGMEEDPARGVVATPVERLHLIPSAPRMAGAEVELAAAPGRERLLTETLAPLVERYRYIIVDTPSSMGILTLNGLLACGETMIPAQTHYFSVLAARQFVEVVRQVNRTFGADLKVTGLIPTMVDRRMKISAELIRDLEGEFGRNLVRPSIRLDARLADAPGKGRPIQLAAPKSNGAYDYTILA
ncbi:MAG: ParA family protein, partial [Nitrospinae bacterium]|nr:ParA family protein [Nitrospinota bacterium]